MKTISPKKAVLLIMLIVIGTISNISAQELVPFTPRETRDNIRGNILMTGNDIVGVLERNGVDYDPNAPFDLFTGNNGPYTTAFIDVDNDNSTFSSSEADLRIYNNQTRESCSSIVYAGLYWSANYYMARTNNVNDFNDDEIGSNSDTNTVLIINNGRLAQEYTVRNSEFDNDNSDIKFSPVTSYMVVAQPVSGCGITNGAQLAGNIAVISNTGSCSIREKVVNAQNAGAVGVVIVHNNGLLPRMTGNGPAINIPSVSIGNNDISNANVNNGDLIPLLQAETNVVLGTLSTEDDDQETGLPLTDPRKDGPADFRNIKFKVPGGSYIDVTASSVVWDGYRNTSTNNSNRANDEVQYVCYSEVTSLIDQDNPFGTYTLADMNATNGQTDGSDGACGGWFLVVIYEDPLESAKYIATSDGYVQIFNGGAPEDYTFSGFTTLQGNQPVDVRFGSAGLEGDRGLRGDALQVLNTANNYTALGQGNNANNDVNPTNNFFASTISFDHQHITDRNPDSENTMGFDADLFDLNNDNNLLIGNNQTDATFRLFTEGDRYSVFFNAFSVTIIEPELRIIKRIYDTDGTTEITGGNVELGDQLFYDLEIENVGNEDLVDGTIVITDILPPNTNLLSVETATLPPGVTFTEVSPGVIEFYIPASLVETPNDGTPGDAPIFIRFRAELVSTCEDLRDACSDIIQNTATATYTGAVSGTLGSTLSSNELGVCGNTDGEASNVLVNVPACQLDVTFCNDELLLVAGTGYNQYTWSGPGIATPVVTTVNFFNVPNPQSGTYTVLKEDTDGVDPSCMSLTEEFTVEDFRDITNPVLDYVNGTTVVTEDCSGLPIPQILLCGDQSLLLETNFDPSSLDDISWQRLSPSGSCVLDPNDPCSLLDGNCTDANWVEVTGGDTPDYTVSEAGDYRILAEFDGGCIIPFYFSVFKNDYQPQLTMNPIECGNDGSVTVTNVPNNFAFSLTPGGPYTNTTGIFAISTPGDVTVYAIDTTFPGCEYTATINVPSIDPTFSVTSSDPSCINDDNGTGFGSIVIAVTAGSPEYEYTIDGPTLTNPIVIPNSSANNGNYTQNNLPPGTYSVEVISNRPAPECIFSTSVTINPAIPFEAEAVLLAPETCDTGALVQINVTSGSGSYLYADSGGNFQSNNVFEIPIPADPTATYTFFVSDQNVPVGEPACVIEVSIDNINPYEPIVIDAVTPTDPVCPGDAGQIRVEVSPQVTGRDYLYELLTTATCAVTDTTYTVVGQINSPLRDVTFTNVTDFDCYKIRVSHNNTTPPGTTPATICPVIQGDYAINSEDAIDATVTLEKELSCEVGNEDAIIRITSVTGGSGSYAWSFSPTGGFTNITTFPVDIAVATAGGYTVYIANQNTGNTCPISRDVTVAPLATVNDLNIVENSTDCSAQTLEVTVSAVPVGPTYTYSVVPAPVSGDATTGVFVLDRGTSYTFTAVRSDNQCSYSEGFIRDILPEIDITSAVEASPVICNGDNDGSLNFTVTNTTDFDWVVTDAGGATVGSGSETGTDPTTVTVNNLPAGDYDITVTDTSITTTSACGDTASVTITEPSALTFTTTATETDCSANTGTITVTATGGRGNYQYRLVDSGGNVIVDYPNTSNIFTGLAVDTYTVFVRDGNDPATACEVNATEDIIESASPTIALATGGDPCFDGTDQATQWITITPGINPPLGPFEYILDRGAGPETPVAVTFLGAPANTFEIDNLAPGNYTVFVRNTNTQCTTGTLNFTINPEITITTNLDKDIDCNGDAVISFIASGGSGTYTQYDLYTTGTPPTLSQANITSTHNIGTPGDYLVQVTDDLGCSAFSNPVTITAYTAVTATAAETNPDCPGDDGSITVTIGTGDGPFTYDLNGTIIGPTGDTTVTFNNIPVGTGYTVDVTDGTGVCTITTNSVDIVAPVAPTGTVAITQDYSCDGSGSSTTPILGEITATISSNGDATPPLEYSIDGINWQASPVFTGLTDGTYTIQVRGANTIACPVSLAPITIDPLVQVTDLSFAATQVQCPALEADVTITPTLDGTSAVQYEITAPITVGPQASNVFTGLTSGTTYTFLARTDSDGCVYTEDFTVPVIDFIAVNGTVVSEPSCNGATDGEISFTVSGIDLTSTTYTYRVNSGPISAPTNVATTNLGSLGAGSYVIEVRDETTLCTAPATITLTDPAVLTVNAAVTTDLTCVQNATITVTVTGGNGGYQYTLVDSGGTPVAGPQTSNVFTVATADTYTVNVVDAESCTASDTVIVADPTPIDATIDAASDFCLDDGAISFTIIIDGTNTGTPDYIYNVTRNGVVVIPDTNVGAATTFTTTPDLTQPGDYVITVTDSNGCFVVLPTQTIEPAVELVATQVADITCDALGNPVDAEFSFVVNGGYTPYDIDVIFNGGAPVNHITNGTAPFANYVATLGAGTYEFVVTDDRGCSFTTSPFTVSNPVAPTITSPNVNVDCDGELGTAIITVTGTETPYEIDFQNTGTFVTITGTQISFANLAEGSYAYTVRSSRGCLYTGTVDIIAPDPITEVNRVETPVTCGGSATVTDLGSIDLEIAGGTANYTYNLVRAEDLFTRPFVFAATDVATPNPVTTGTNVSFDGLDFGQYYIIVEDANGCDQEFGPFNIFSPPNDLLQNITVSATCPGGVTFEIDVQGGSGINPPANPPPGFDIRIVGEPSPGLGDFVPLDDSVGGPTAVDANTPIRDHTYSGLDFNRTYILEVRDNATNCLYQEVVNPVSPPSEPNITNLTVSDVSCNETPAVNDGEISFDISGYDPSVTQVSWEVFDQITNVTLGVAYTGTAPAASPATIPVTISNFSPGQYYVVVREDDGTLCPTRADFVIDIPDPLDSAITAQTPANSCGTNAFVTLQTTGGTPFGIPPTADGYTYEVVADGAGDPGTYTLNSNVIDLGIVAGDFDIWVADANNCSFGPIDVMVVVNPLPTVTAAFIDDCTYDNSNIIDVDGTGLGTLLYQLDGGTAVVGSIDNNNHEFTVSTPGTYTISITDESGCTVSTSVTVYDELVIVAEFTTAPTCENADGVITTTVNSGVVQGTLTYVLQDGTGTPTGNTTGDATGIYTGVAAGNYIVVATDDGRGVAPGCSFSAPVSIDAPTPPVLVPATTLVTCVGDTDGVITATLTAGSTDADPAVTYQYEIIAGPALRPIQSSPVFTGLGIGTYTVEVTATKPNGSLSVICTDTEDYIIANPTLATATITNTAYTCAADGTTENFPVITIDTFAGGSGAPYRIEYIDPSGNTVGPVDANSIDIDGNPANGIQIIANEAGNYTFTLYDSNNCPNPLAPYNIPAFPIMTDAVINQVTPIDCATNTEEVTVTVTGGTGPYDFVEINGAVPPQNNVASGGATTTSASFFLPGVGNYIFRVTDQATGCTIDTAPYEVLPYDTIEANIVVIAPDILCFGDATGNIELTVTGHTGPYNYTVTNTTTATVTGPFGADTTVQNPITITGLEAGNIQVSITDPVSTCDDDSNVVTITQPTELTLALVSNDNAYCTSDGRVVVEATGGTAPYTFTADDGVNPVFTNNTGDFSLPGGPAPGITYTITVTDANSCTSNPASLSVDVIETADPTLDPLTVDDVCTHDGSYEITATGTSNVTGGTGALRFQLDGGTIVDANNGLNSHIFTVSTPGTYTVTAYDENGCPTNVESITILPELIASADFTADPTCRDFDGTITVTVTGGSDFGTNPVNFTFVLTGTDSAGNPVNISQNGATGTENVFTNISAGTYTVTITDINIPAITAPCSITIDVPTLPVPVDPIITASATAVSCIGATDGVVTVVLTNPITDDAPYTYQLFVDTGGGVPGAQIGVDQIDNPVFTNLPTGNYVAIVTSDRDCSGQALVTVPNATQVVATAAQTAYSCAADNSEVFPIITVTIQDGTAPYTVIYTTPSGNTVTAVDVVDADATAAGVQYEFVADEEGNYVITVTDFNGCNTSPVTITESVGPFPVMTNPLVTVNTPISCVVAEDVLVTVEGISTGLYDFVETTGTGLSVTGVPFGTNDIGATPQTETGALFTLPNVGVYIFEITDQTTGCTITVSHEIQQFDNIISTATQQTPESCFGDADGQAVVTIEGYAGDLSYQIVDIGVTPEVVVYTSVTNLTTDGDVNTADTFIVPPAPDGLTTGNYRIDFTELNAPLCTDSAVFTILGPATPVDLILTAINDTEFCDPAANGAIQASVTGARGTVTYQIARASAPATILETNTDGLFEGLTADTYEVTVIDNNGLFSCSDTDTFVINPPADDVVVALTPTNISCFGAADGSITVNATGTDVPFVYTITPSGGVESAIQTSNVFNFLTANTYIINVYDIYGCAGSNTIDITEPNEVTVVIDNATEVTCAIDTVDVTVTGNGDFPIESHVLVNVTDDLNPVETVFTTNTATFTFTGLAEGEYQFYVIDVNGCRSQLSAPVPVVPIDQITFDLDLSAANVNCTDEASGIVNLGNITGGIGDYRFQLTNNTTGVVLPGAGLFQAESQFTDLPPGDYTYLVESDRGCSTPRNFTIVNPPLFEEIPPEVTNVVCFGEDNGSIIVFAAGGTGSYSFAISTDPGQFFNDESDNVLNQHTFTNLVPGVYQVFAQDSNGCGQVYDVTIGEPEQLMANIVGAVTPETCFGDSDGAVTIEITGGTPPYSTNITNNDSDFVEGVLTYMDLPGGTTTIFVRDANNCRINLPVDIPEGAILNGVMIPRADCPIYNADGTVSQPPVYYIDFVLGEDSVDTDIIYNLVSTDGGVSPGDSLSPTFIVQPGEYQGTMTYTPTGCVFDAGLITIEVYDPLLPPIAIMTNNPQDPNEYEIRVGGTEPYNSNYTYFVAIIPDGLTINDLTDADYRELDTNVFSIDETAEYALRVVDNSFNDCPITASQELTYINIVIPNYFTPDSDGTNDYWYPRQDSANPGSDPFFFSDMEVRVFDRYGRLLAEFVGEQQGWDGIYQGSELPSGDYWFTIILNDIDNREFTGHFTLYR
ncbi:T9SS type B sorting domain-containing protein [Aquimarina sp. M1]